MFQGTDLNELVELLSQRGAFLYHACQLLDFCSYLRVGGIPSRAYLEKMEQPFTLFDTDAGDRHKNVWDKVFGNLSDFGFTFARGYDAVPNTYGPILFQIKPEAFSEANDVAICLRSAGGNNFNREAESLSSIEDVNRLFKNPVEQHGSNYVKYRTELKQEFSEITSDISAPEISCTVNKGYLPLEYVKFVRVEPYNIQGNQLLTLVEKFSHNYHFPVCQRDQVPAYTQELIKVISQEISLTNLCQNQYLSPELRNWAIRVRDRSLEYQFNRFAKYLYKGTILPVVQNQL
jgi:hypothetical protein